MWLLSWAVTRMTEAREVNEMGKVILDVNRCKSCDFCVFSCPKQAISKSGNYNIEGYEYVQVDEDKCIVCGICYTVCPDGVFEIEA